LFLRFATDKDTKKDETKPENSRFYKYSAGMKRKKVAEAHQAKQTRIYEARKATNLMKKDIKKAKRERRRRQDSDASDCSDKSSVID